MDYLIRREIEIRGFEDLGLREGLDIRDAKTIYPLWSCLHPKIWLACQGPAASQVLPPQILHSSSPRDNFLISTSFIMHLVSFEALTETNRVLFLHLKILNSL